MVTMFLLGAGASMAAGVPMAIPLTKAVSQKITDSPFREAYNFVIGQLISQRSNNFEDPYSGVDLERVLDALDFLSDYKSSVVSAFATGWNPTIVELDKTAPPIPPLMESALAITQMILHLDKNADGTEPTHQERFNTVMRELQTIVKTTRLEEGNGAIFLATAAIVRHHAARLCKIANDSNVSYLQPLIDSIKHQKQTVIASLNYDNAIELLAEKNGITLYTGFDDWLKTGNLELPPEGLSLLKLHGSISWEKWNAFHPEGRMVDHPWFKHVEHGAPAFEGFGVRTQSKPIEGRLEKVLAGASKTRVCAPAIILGGTNKLSIEGPYIPLMYEFGKRLNGSDRLIIIGYSFRDDHINHFIAGWINRKDDTKITVISPSFSESSVPFAKELRTALAKDDRINIINKGAEDGLHEIKIE